MTCKDRKLPSGTGKLSDNGRPGPGFRPIHGIISLQTVPAPRFAPGRCVIRQKRGCLGLSGCLQKWSSNASMHRDSVTHAGALLTRRIRRPQPWWKGSSARALGPPMTCLLHVPSKALLTLFPLADTVPQTLQPQGATVRRASCLQFVQ